MNTIQRKYLLSLAIGDGYVDKYGGIVVSHAEAKVGYLEWKIQKAADISLPKPAIRTFQNGVNKGVCARFSGGSWGKLLRKVLYDNTDSRQPKNIYQRRVLDKLDRQGIAIWYMDDGGLTHRTRDGVRTGSIDLCLNTITSLENNQVVVNYFNERWAIPFFIVFNRGYYRLRCSTKRGRLFKREFGDIVEEVECMRYKLAFE